MAWRVVGKWKSGKKDSSGRSLTGWISVWNGSTKKAAEKAVQNLLSSDDGLLSYYRTKMSDFRIEKV